MKKFISILLSLILIAATVPVCFSETDDQTPLTVKIPNNVFVNAGNIFEEDENEYYFLTVFAEASSYDTLTFDWYFYDDTFGSGEYRLFENEHYSQLCDVLLPKKAVDWTTWIYCVVTDTKGNTAASNRAKVIDVYPPEVTIPETLIIDRTAFADGFYTCRISPETTNPSGGTVSFRWYCKIGENDWFTTDCTSEELEIKLTEEQILSGVDFRCEASAFDGYSTFSDLSHVELLPYFNEVTVSDAQLNEPASLTASAVSTYELDYNWYYSKNGKSWSHISDNEKYSGANTTTLTVSSMTEEDFDIKYRCFAFVDEQTFYSASAKFKRPAIVITAQPESTSAHLHSDASFSVAAEGVTLSCKWQYFDTSSKSWKSVTKSADVTAAGESTPNLTLSVNTPAAYSLSFRCAVSDTEKTVYSEPAVIYPVSADDLVTPLRDTLLIGDVDLNGKIEAADARFALRAAVGIDYYPEETASFIAADWDDNGIIEPSDARMILRRAVGLED